MKTCKTCLIEKELTEYYCEKKSNTYKQSCKACWVGLNRKYREENKEKVAALKHSWFQRVGNAKRRGKPRYKERYGITLDTYLELNKQQDGKCAICSLPSKENTGGKLYVDHSHESKSVRGLLCMNCNTSIGLMQEDPERLEEAAKYLRKWKQ